PARSEKSHLRWTAIHQQTEDIIVAELSGNIVRRDMPAEGPLVNRAAGFGVVHRDPLTAHAHPNALRVCIEMSADEIRIAEGRRQQDVGLAATLYEITRPLLTIAYPVLRGRGFVVHVARIDVSPTFQQELRDLDRPREM